MRSDGIEIKIDKKKIPQEVLDLEELDIEYSSKKKYDILWIHDDGYKPFLEKHFEHLDAAEEVYNRKTKTDHLNIYTETEDEVDEYGIDDKEKNVKLKNIKFSELKDIDITKVKFKRDIKEDKNK